MKMDAYSFGVLVLWLLYYFHHEEWYHMIEDASTAASDDGLSFVNSTFPALTQAKNSSLVNFFRQTLTSNAADRSLDFRQFRDLLFSDELFIHSNEEPSDLGLGYIRAPLTKSFLLIPNHMLQNSW